MASPSTSKKRPIHWQICFGNDASVVIGTIGCRWANRNNRCMEMGYALGEPHWGKGIIVESARGLLNVVFRDYEVERVQAHTFAENVASARVLEKLAFTFEGTHRSALFHRGRFWDLKMYSILRGEWRVMKQ